jgi:hypothetical protein
MERVIILAGEFHDELFIGIGFLPAQVEVAMHNAEGKARLREKIKHNHGIHTSAYGQQHPVAGRKKFFRLYIFYKFTDHIIKLSILSSNFVN